MSIELFRAPREGENHGLEEATSWRVIYLMHEEVHDD